MKHEIKSRHKRFEANDKFKKLMYDNDGIVSVESAKWGNYVGTLDQVDHLDLINWTNKTKRVVDKLLFNEDSKFNAIALYLDIANNLAKEGV
jgi:triacylglycerol lipase